MRIEIRNEKKLGDAVHVLEFTAEDEGLHEFGPAIEAVTNVIYTVFTSPNGGTQ